MNQPGKGRSTFTSPQEGTTFTPDGARETAGEMMKEGGKGTERWGGGMRTERDRTETEERRREEMKR